MVSTLAIGSNPERVRKARRSSDIVGAREVSLRWRLLAGTLGPAAPVAVAAVVVVVVVVATARRPESSSVIYKCH